MSLRDRLRGIQGTGRSGNGGGHAPTVVDHASQRSDVTAFTIAVLSGDRGNVMAFVPREDADYHCTERGLYLRFARPVVMECDDQHPNPARGEFTLSGRFVVQRRFERPVVYVALTFRTESLTMRRTDTAGGPSEELVFTLELDDPDRA